MIFYCILSINHIYKRDTSSIYSLCYFMSLVERNCPYLDLSLEYLAINKPILLFLVLSLRKIYDWIFWITILSHLLLKFVKYTVSILFYSLCCTSLSLFSLYLLRLPTCSTFQKKKVWHILSREFHVPLIKYLMKQI